MFLGWDVGFHCINSLPLTFHSFNFLFEINERNSLNEKPLEKQKRLVHIFFGLIVYEISSFRSYGS